MSGEIDKGLRLLRMQGAEYRLDGLERDVRLRIEARRADATGRQAWPMQLAVTCGSLLIGVAVAQLAGVSVMPEPLSSEVIVLSDDSAVAPSVILEGGI
jgi:pyruvate carboxylase